MAWISTAKFAAVSIFAAFLATAAERFRIPAEIAGAWSSAGAWMKPPYLYIVVNGIILSIAASSRFHFHYCKNNKINSSEEEEEANNWEDLDEKLSGATSTAVVVVVPQPLADDYYCCRHRDDDREIVVVKEVIKLADDDDDDDDDDDLRSTVEMNRGSWEEDINLELVTEKPRRRVLAKPKSIITATSQEGFRASNKPKRPETFENTWKMITEGRPRPLNRQMKKSETWGNNRRRILEHEVVDKSETFKERTNEKVPAVVPKLRKEASLSQDELNKRVEAFINKFNEEMRLQRQESLDQYMDMINRGTH